VKNFLPLLLVLSVAFSLSVALGQSAGAQDWAKTRLEKSPRHLEWIDVKQGSRIIKCFIAYPQVKEKATTVLVIHEIFGLSDWIRDTCDQFAEAGYIAIAPDLLSGKKGEDTEKYKSVDEVRKAVSGLPKDQVAKDLKSVADYAAKLPAANGKVVTSGYCWGGTQVWNAMTTNKNLKSGFVFYGAPKESLDNVNRIASPVYGFYGENDNRVTSTVEDTTKKMMDAKKTFEPKVFTAAGHGFMRSGDGPDAPPADVKARDESWQILKEKLGSL